MPLIPLVISIVLSGILVNSIQRLFMKMIGADFMTFNASTKIIITVFLGFVMYAVFLVYSGYFGKLPVST